MNPNRIYGQPSLSSQRVQRATMNPNEPTPCKKCGSIFFTEVTAQMYTSGSSGYRSVSVTPMKVYKCLCGELQMPPGVNSGNVAGGERDLFAQSLAAAQAYRAETGVDAAAKGFAGIHELRELTERVALLQAQLTELAQEQGLEVNPIQNLTAEGAAFNERAAATGLHEVDTDEPEPVHEDLVSQPPVATRTRGRSQAGSTEPKGDVKFIEPMQQPVVEGGARARMRRQGK